MTKRFKALAAAALTALAPAAFAAGHYVPGVEGTQAGSVPGPGMYYLGYVVNYNIDKISGAPGTNTGSVTALANRFVWITNHKFLGADYGVEAIVPLQNTSLTFSGVGVDSSSNGVADIYIGPVVLGWHGANWDGVFAAGEWFDTGSYSATDPSSVGNGYKSTMLTLGGTFYPDAAKKWSASALARFETNGTQSGTGIKPGNGLSVEWGIARQLAGGMQLGLVGYYQDQTSSSSGVGANPANPHKNAIGAQFDLPLLEHGMFLKFAAYQEYGASGGATQGKLFRMTLVKVL